MTHQVRVNVSTLVNASKIRREKRDGRDVVIVPSATLPDGVVMNGLRYPAAVIAESYKSLEGRPAPLGHPTVNGKYVSASSPEGIVRSFIGAHNENVRRENGRVFLDKVIDVQFANQSEGGKAVLAAIEKEEPVHTSTGLLATLKPLTNAEDGAKFEVESMILDHDCFLLDQPGAATPEQGVGLFVNAAGEEIEVINSSLEDDINRDMDWQIDALLRTVERKKQLPLLERMKMSILRIIDGDPTPDTIEGAALTTNEEAMDKAQFDELSGKVAALSETVAGIPETLATAVANALKPFTDAQAARDEADKAKAEADRLALVNQVVEAGLLEEDVAKDASAPVLNALLAKPKLPGAAFRVNGAFKPAANSDERKPLALKGE